MRQPITPQLEESWGVMGEAMLGMEVPAVMGVGVHARTRLSGKRLREAEFSHASAMSWECVASSFLAFPLLFGDFSMSFT